MLISHGQDYVYITYDKNNNIIISPKFYERSKQDRIITIRLNKEDINLLNRLVTSSYVNNYNKIILYGNLPSKEFIRKKVHDLIAIEIIEQTPDKVIIKDFLDPDEIRPLSLLKKIDNLIRIMFSEYKNLKEILEYEMDINRLMFLSLRGILYNKRDEESIRLWQATTFLEKIGDCLKRFSRHYNSLDDEVKQKVNIRKLEKLVAEIYQTYKSIMNNFFKMDKDKAVMLAEERKKLISKINKQIQQVFDYEDVDNTSKNNLVELLINLKEAVVYMNDINRLLYFIIPQKTEE